MTLAIESTGFAMSFDSLRLAIVEQHEFMERCGSDLAGYLRRYGDRGEAIYKADYAQLVGLCTHYLMKRRLP